MDADAVKEGLQASSGFSTTQLSRLTEILGRFGSRRCPTPGGLREQVIQAARFEYLVKPSAALQAISSGIPPSHAAFWRAMSVKSLHTIYLALTATPEKVLELLLELELADQDQQHVVLFAAV